MARSIKNRLADNISAALTLTSLNKSGRAVRDLQTALSFVGFESSDDEKRDCRFGPKTLGAVKEFQKSKGLQETGRFNSATRKALRKAMLEKDASLSATLNTHTVKGSVFDNDGNALGGKTVRLTLLTGETFTRTTGIKGFYNLPFRAPRLRSGAAASSFEAQITVSGADGTQLYARTLVVKSRSSFVNFGKYYPKSEYLKTCSAVGDAFGATSVIDLLAASSSRTPATIAKTAAVTAERVSALYLAQRLSKALDGSSISIGGMTEELLYGLVRAGVPADTACFLESDSAFSDIAALKDSLLLTKFMSTGVDTLRFAIVKASGRNICNHTFRRQSTPIAKSYIQAVASYYLSRYEIGGKVHLEDILALSSVDKSKYWKVALAMAGDPSLGEAFLKDESAGLTEAEKENLESVLVNCEVLLYNLQAAGIMMRSYGKYHLSCITHFSDTELKGIGVTDLEGTKAAIRERFPEESFINALHEEVQKGVESRIFKGLSATFPSGGDTWTFIQNTVVSCINLIWPESIDLDNATRKRFVLSDMSLIDSYWFINAKDEDANAAYRKAARVLQRLYKISPDPETAILLLGKGVTSAVSAFYTGRRKLGVSAQVWAGIEDIYWKTVTLYNDIVEASRDNSRSVVKTSANLRSLFGSLDSYTYDDSLSLLSPAAYLADLLRFLENLKISDSRSAFDVFDARRPDIKKILLNKDNSEVLVPQIDNVCEVLEDRVSSVDWSKVQTDGDDASIPDSPQFTNHAAYRILRDSASPAAAPGFDLQAVRIREALRKLGAPGYELMKLLGADDVSVAFEYFGMPQTTVSLFEGGAKHGWTFSVGEDDGLYSVPVLTFMSAAGLDYDDTVRLCEHVGALLTDADPYNAGYPDVEKQCITFRSKDDTLLRLQRMTVLFHATGLQMAELIGYAGDASADTAFVVKLMNALSLPEETEDVLSDSFSKEDIGILTGDAGSSFKDIDALASGRNVETGLLEAFSEWYDGSGAPSEMKPGALVRAAVLADCLDASPEELEYVFGRFGADVWTEDVLRELTVLIVFNHNYKLDGKLPFETSETLSAADCTRAARLIDIMNALGVESESRLREIVASGDYDSRKEVADSLMSKLRKTDLREVEDAVRTAKRDALVAWLLAERYRDKDVNGLFDELLLDVQMGPEQDTTRIKMATNAVQLFVQRCLLGLEMEVDASSVSDEGSDSWSRWSWMKNYRVWEAARKIFFFPENWIDPELRTDETPEFKDFISEIEQGEGTVEQMETALENYLCRLDELAFLEVCGIYRQKETGTDVWHVVARTRSATPVWYYRYFDCLTGEWSAWEKMDLEIEGDQILPVVYNRRLYVFWLKFCQKALKMKKLPGSSGSDTESEAPEAATYYEIQLVWSCRKTSGWAPQTIGRQKLIHPWDRPRHSYDIKPYIDRTNRLHIDIYLVTSREFNEKAAPSTFNYYPDFKCRYSNVPYSESSTPWHSSTFIFEGDVTGVLMKDLEKGTSSSLQFIRDNFGEDGRAIKPLGMSDSGARLLLPEGMHVSSNRLVNNTDTLNSGTLNTQEVQTRFLDNEYVNKFIGEKLHAAGWDSPGADRKEISRYISAYRAYLVNSACRSVTLLEGASDPFELVLSQQTLQLSSMPEDNLMFYQDRRRALSLRTVCTGTGLKYRADLFYHPYSAVFIKALRESGLDGVFSHSLQMTPWSHASVPSEDGRFFDSYKPTDKMASSPEETVDFSRGGAYSAYNWELFFHIPLAVACRLSSDGKYEEAMKWFHFIFNPMDYSKGTKTPERFWVTKPFYENTLEAVRSEDSSQRVETILRSLSKNSDQLTAWKNNPFSPHIIAKYRTGAYQKAVVMKYIGNLIDWADSKFREDTMESINEATLLYVLAWEILGQRPQKVAPPKIERYDMDYEAFRYGMDGFGNSKRSSARVDVLLKVEDCLDADAVEASSSSSDIPVLDVFYFDVPENSELEKYWDTVEDRLVKIRASRNIDGVFRKLSINAPEIDPAALVQAAATGAGAADAVAAATQVQRPPYRFSVALRMAQQICSEVKGISEKLLSTWEKEDSEELNLMRIGQEQALQKAIKDIRALEIKEMESNIKSLEANLDRATASMEFYRDIEAVSTNEAAAMKLNEQSLTKSAAALPLNASSAALMAAGNIVTGVHGVMSTPVCHYEMCFQGVGQSIQVGVSTLQMEASINDRKAGLISTGAAYARRSAEWALQASSFAKEVESVTNQLEASRRRLEIAERNSANHLLQMEQTEAVRTFVRTKFTGRELYSLMKSQLASLLREAYDLSFDYARKAEACYEFEIGEKPGIIRDCWNSKSHGILSGDILLQQLGRLEQKYLENNTRGYELVKRVPLSSIPSDSEFRSALYDLIYKGECRFSVTEGMYDMDYTDHCFRKLKSVSVSIPCVVGPNVNVNCSLTLLSHAVRRDGRKEELVSGSVCGRASIATSSAVNDSGMFELSFNDSRYLPFEGYGAVSEWEMKLPFETNRFDRRSISEVMVNIFYTACPATEGRSKASGSSDGGLLDASLNPVRTLSLRHDLPSVWAALRDGATSVEASLPEGLFPWHMRKGEKTLVSVIEEAEDGTVSKKSAKSPLLTMPEGGVAVSDEGVLTLALDRAVDRKASDVKLAVRVKLS